MAERRRNPQDLGEYGVDGQAALPGALSVGYAMGRSRWDEAISPEGLMRPHWDSFMQNLAALPADEMEARWDRGQRLIRENGVTYNVYGDPRGLDRPWQLDPVPMIISAEEWRSIEAALVQRATLLNHVLGDLYGHQDLVARGLLPPALAYAHPGYLRPLRHVTPPGGVHLHLYAADLARSPDGQWWVMADRCEAPSGAGYALENRVIVARSLAEMLRSPAVQPLTPFFQKLRDTLLTLSPRNREAPRTVLLTPGPYNETYFEHAYLARHLGCTLVESGDLTMRDSKVFLKTLDGLQQVDMILRRTDGAFCDPLELRSDSSLGVAGLVQAVRAGNLVVANSLGSGVLEGGAIAPFMASLSRHMLGEDLKMPSVATWWCGGERERRYVLEHMEELVIKLAFPRPGGMLPVFGDSLDAQGREKLAEAIRSRPYDYLAQERVRLSTLPVWSQSALEPRPMMIRVFLAAHDGGYVAMPGGLTRVAAERDGSMVSMQQGGGSKDTWVLAESTIKPPVTLRPANAPVKLVRGSRDLSSRVADNLFWFGRYVERSENSTRLLRSALSRSGSSAGFSAAEELPVALSLLRGIFRPEKTRGVEAELAAITRMAFNNAHASGLRATVERVHRMAALARDRLSPDTWRAVNRLLQEAGSVRQTKRVNIEDALNACNNVVLAAEALSGLAMENMTRGLGWRFVDIGRRLERAVNVVDLLSGVLVEQGGAEGGALDLALEISDSAMTYRSRYLSIPQFAPVLDLLLADESNPRSLAFQICALGAHMDHLANSRRSAFFGPEQRLTIWLIGAIRTADIQTLCQPDEDGDCRNLAGFLEALRSKLWELSETITREYFTHAVSRNSAPASVIRELMP